MWLKEGVPSRDVRSWGRGGGNPGIAAHLLTTDISFEGWMSANWTFSFQSCIFYTNIWGEVPSHHKVNEIFEICYLHSKFPSLALFKDQKRSFSYLSLSHKLQEVFWSPFSCGLAIHTSVNKEDHLLSSERNISLWCTRYVIRHCYVAFMPSDLFPLMIPIFLKWMYL